MARIQDGVLKDWLDGQVVKSNEYKQEREILRTAINDNMTRNETNATSISNVDTRVTALETDNTENKSDIASLEDRMTSAEGVNSTQSTDISSLQSRMTNAESTNTTQDSNIGNLQTRMTAAESKNTEQDTRLTGVEGKNTQQDNDISSLGSRVGSLESSDSTQNNRLTNIESTNNGQGQDISDLQLRVNGVESKNIAQDGRLDVLEGEVNGFDSRISSNETSVTNFNTRLNDHTNSVNAHRSENISYSGKVSGATEVKTGLDKLNDRVDGIVASAGTGNTEIVDARLGMDGTAHPVLKSRLDKMEGYLTENAKQSQTLVHGVQVVNATQNSPVDFEVQGRTLVNNSMSNLLPSSYYVLADKKLKVRAEGKEGTLISGVAKFQKSNAVLTKADFIGKVSGSVTENAHSTKVKTNATNLSIPSDFISEFTTSNYGTINTLNGVTGPVATSTSGTYAQILFSFNIIEQIERKMGRIPASDVAGKVQWIKDNVNRLTANWHGFGSSVGGNKATFSVYTVSSSSWSTGLNHTSGTVTKLNPSYTVNIGNYISTDGFVHFLAYAEPSDGVTASQINTDFVELEIELKTTAVLDTRPILTRIANFENKVSASTVENPHIAKPMYGTSLLAPSQVTFGEAVSDFYTRINSLNSTNATTTNLTNGNMAQHLFSFDLIQEVERNIGRIPKSTVADKVQWLKDNVQSFSCEWTGFGNSVGGNNASFSVWNTNSLAWNSPSTNTGSTPTKTIVASSNLTDKIDSNGVISFLSYANASDGTTASTINTDYIELSITLKQGATLFEPVAPIYEVDSTEYGNILVSWDEANVLNRYPKVQGVQHIQNLAVIAEGENLLPPFSEWTLHANAKVISPYELELNATGTYQASRYTVSTIVGQKYTIAKADSNYMYAEAENESGLASGVLASVTGTTMTFTATTSKTRIILDNRTTNGKFTFTQPILNLGSTAKPFTPRNPSYLFAPTKLGQIGDKKDVLSYSDGQWYKRKLVEKDVVLDGSLAWIGVDDRTGYKWARVSSSTFSRTGGSGNLFVTKYNGQKLGIVSGSSWTGFSDTQGWTDFAYDFTGSNFYIAISDLDTGFGETYSAVTSQELQAYFNGWTAKTVDVNGKPTAWKSLGDGTDAPTQTLAYVSTTKAPNYKPYSLSYVLATPQTLTIPVEGDITVSGATQVEVTSGVIVREKVTPVLVSGVYYLNRTDKPSQLKNKVSSMFKIHKNSVDDSKVWTYSTDKTVSYGSQSASIAQTLFDTTATYEVTYLMLDRHLFTNNATEVKGFYESNLKGVVDNQVEKVADLSTQSSVNTQYIYRLLIAAKAAGWTV